MTLKASPRTDLRFQTGAEIVAEIRRLRRDGYERAGRWNLTQVCDHLTRTMDVALRPDGKRLPWIVRRTVGRWLVGHILRRGKFPRGTPAPKKLRPADAAADDPATIDACIAKVQEAAGFDGDLSQYPGVDGMTPDVFRRLSWIHASHHLGFLVPRNPAV